MLQASCVSTPGTASRWGHISEIRFLRNEETTTAVSEEDPILSQVCRYNAQETMTCKACSRGFSLGFACTLIYGSQRCVRARVKGRCHSRLQNDKEQVAERNEKENARRTCSRCTCNVFSLFQGGPAMFLDVSSFSIGGSLRLSVCRPCFLHKI